MSQYKKKLEALEESKTDDSTLHIIDESDLLQIKTFLSDFAMVINKSVLDKESSTYETQAKQYKDLKESIQEIVKAIDKGIEVNNLNQIEQLKEIVVTNLKDIQITTEKVDIPDWLATDKGFDRVVESVDIATRQIKALQDVKPSQKVDDYIPYRRVRYDGFKLVYDDSYWGATSGGGSGASNLGYAIKIDDYTTANVTYIGKARIKSSTSSAVWQIQKIDETTGMTITWADGDDSYDNVWGAAGAVAGLSYS